MKHILPLLSLSILLFSACQGKRAGEDETCPNAAPIVKAPIPAVDWLELGEVKYIQYYNHRFEFSVDYPDFMLKDQPPENGDGFGCHCQGLDICGWGSLNSDPVTTLKRSIETVAAEYAPDADTVLHKEPDMMVVKGHNNGRVYYWKFVNYTDVTYCLNVEYDAQYADVINPIAIHTLESFDCTHPEEKR